MRKHIFCSILLLTFSSLVSRLNGEPQEGHKEEEAKFKNGDVTLAGTLTLPSKPGPHPAVILLAGSGEQTRNAEALGFKPFQVIAHHFAANGIASLRYDKRGSGESTGNVNDSTIENFGKDALAGLNWLKGRSEIDSARIGLVGHSEGGVVAQWAASGSKDVDFLILLSSPAVPTDELAFASMRLIAKASGATEEEIKEQVEEQERLFRAVRTGTGWENVEADIRKRAMAQIEMVPEEHRKALDIDAMVEEGLVWIKSPNFKYWLDFDPSAAIKKLSCPVLAFYGELDMQVPAEMNKDALVQALVEGGNQHHTVEIMPKANHFFMQAETGLPTEMPSLEKKFVPGLLDLLTSWVNKELMCKTVPGAFFTS
jgi:fermentation-respiration switch protein FrsA (DUF1100 family)